MYEKNQKHCKFVNVYDTFVDTSYQRVCHRSVQKIAANWDWRKVGVPKLSERPDGRYAIVDGQHRLEAFKLWLSRQRDIKEVDKLIECEILTGLTVQDEALIFASQGDNRTAVTPLEELRAALTNGDARNPYVLLHRIMTVENCIPIVNSDAHTVGVRCVRALRDKCVQYGAKFLEYYAHIMRRAAWTSRYASFSLTYVRVLAELFNLGVPEASVVQYLKDKLPSDLLFAVQKHYSKARVSVGDIVQYILNDAGLVAKYGK